MATAHPSFPTLKISGALILSSLIAASCVPKNVPEAVGPEPSAEGAVKKADKAAKGSAIAPAPGTEVLLGQMCPEASSGRPAVLPLVARRAVWQDGSEDLGALVERRQARQFSVLGWDGRRVGVFSVAGAADNEGEPVAIGAYAGNAPCGSQPQADGAASSDASCVSALGQCGLALSVLESASGSLARPYEEQGDPASFGIGQGCVADGKLIVDVDADGKGEAFAVEDFVAAFTEPSDSVNAIENGESQCQGTFAAANVMTGTDPKGFRGMDLIGVVDMDGDKRRELVFAFRYPDKVTWAVYSSRKGAGLELVGENVVWTPGSAPAATESLPAAALNKKSKAPGAKAASPQAAE